MVDWHTDNSRNYLYPTFSSLIFFPMKANSEDIFLSVMEYYYLDADILSCSNTDTTSGLL